MTSWRWCCSFLTLALGGGALCAAAPEAPYPQLAEHAGAIATVKFVLALNAEGAEGERELEGEADCLAIDARGMVVCSNTELGGYAALLGRMMGGGFNMSATPKNIMVSFGGLGEALEGRLLARDTERDLVWVQVTLPAEAKIAFLDFESSSAELAVGERYYVLRPMGEFFGRAPLVATGVVGAIAAKPRKLFVPEIPNVAGFGRPVFDARGRLVGITVLQMPGAEDQGAQFLGSSMAFLGQAVRFQDMVGGLILPAAEVAKATRLARESFGEAKDGAGE